MIAAIAVDVSLPHLDRAFDYRVPPELEAAIGIGVRVRVGFAGRLVTGIVLELHDDSTRATADIRAVVSPAVVLTSRMANLVRAVADRYAGTFSDVLRFAVPARHAKTESAALDLAPMTVESDGVIAGCWDRVHGGSAFLARAAHGEPVAACLELPARESWVEAVAAAVRATAHAVSVIVTVADARDVDALDACLRANGITPIVMRAADGPAARQRAFTAISRAERVVVIGTRAAVFAPITGSGLTIIVGDGNDALVESQSPGWHAREVALLRTQVLGWATAFVARHRSVEMQRLVETGVVKPLQWNPTDWRTRSVRVESAIERYDDADPLLQRLRIPPSVFKAMRTALAHGSVLVSVAHRGYVTSMRCQGCREIARCSRCRGPLGVAAGSAVPRCRWCGESAGDWKCQWCGDGRTRHQTLGVERTMEELGKAFPDTPLRLVDVDHRLHVVPDHPHLLFVTPGMEPTGEVALAVVLDADLVLARHDLAAGTEAVRRWSDVAATVAAEGRMIIVGQPSAPAVQAMLRNDPAGFAERELAERAAAGLPPAVHAAIVVAPPTVAPAQEIVDACPGARLLGPVPVDGALRWVVLHDRLAELTHAVRTVVTKRSAAKTLAGVGIRVDPLELPT